MTLTYNLTEEDYLQSQLFVSSKSERVNKQRKKRWLWVTGLFLVVGVFSYDDYDPFFSYYLVGLGLISAFFYPKYSAYLYRRHYTKYVRDVHKNNFNETVNVIFGEHAIETHDRAGTSKINLTEIESISETASYFYLKLKSGPHLIIPKAKLSNIPELRDLLIAISERLNFDFISELNWKWK